MDKKNQEKLTCMGLVAYHAGLSRKDRVKLKNYVAGLFELSYSVIDLRFTGRMHFTPAELLALQPVIEGETWRQ